MHEQQVHVINNYFCNALPNRDKPISEAQVREAWKKAKELYNYTQQKHADAAIKSMDSFTLERYCEITGSKILKE